MASALPDRGLALALLAAGLMAGSSCGPPAPPPPRVSHVQDPDIARRIEEAYRAASAKGAGGAALGHLGQVYQAHAFLEAAATTYELASARGPLDLRWTYLRALALHDLGRLDEALAALTGIPEAAYPAAQVRLGYWLLEQGREGDAEGAFRAAVARSPSSVNASLGLARIELARGQAEAARARLETLLAGSPHVLHGHHLLGTAYRALGQVEAARTALERGAGSSLSWAAEDPWATEMTALQTGYAPLLQEARSLVAAGRKDRARALYQSLRRAHPGDVPILTDLAFVLEGSGEKAAADHALAEALKAHPGDFAVHLARGRIEQLRGNFEAAIAATREAVRLNPPLAAAWTQLGIQLLLGGRNQEAQEALEGSLRLRPEDAETQLMLGRAKVRLGKPEEALATFTAATVAFPRHAEAWLLRGAACHELGRIDEAIASFEAGLEVEPGHAALAEALARARARGADPHPTGR